MQRQSMLKFSSILILGIVCCLFSSFISTRAYGESYVNSNLSFKASDSQEILSFIKQHSNQKKLNLAGRRFDQRSFSALIDSIIKHPIIKELLFSKSQLTAQQITQLQILASTKKGLRIVDSEGAKFGPAYMNWQNYNMEKSQACLRGLQAMTPTTTDALELFELEYGRKPETVMDFGCGVGQDTIPMAKMGCEQIFAIDADEEALDLLKSNLPIEAEAHVSLINSPFIEVQVDEPVELFIAGYTWPYRRPEMFDACWKKSVESVKVGGYIAGQFFGPFSNKKKLDPGMTYHTEADILELLSDNFELVSFRKESEGSDFKIFGGADAPWGDLYHIVARRIR